MKSASRSPWRHALAAAVFQWVAAGVSAADVTWSTPGTGFWDDVGNWPGGVLPSDTDDVTVDIGSATAVVRQLPGASVSPLSRYTVASLLAKSPFEHAGGSLLVKGNATFQESFTWSGGVIHVDGAIPSGTWTFEKGIHLTAPSLVGMNAGAVELRCTSVLEGGVGVLLGNVPVHIAAGATLDIRSGDRFAVQASLVNDGTIDRTAGTGNFDISLQGGGNQGVVRNRTGVLSMLQGGFDAVTHAGTFTADAGAELRFFGPHTFSGAIAGEGDVTFADFREFKVDAARFALEGTLTLRGGANGIWNGDGSIRSLRLDGGNFRPQSLVDVVNRGRVDNVSFVIGAPGSRVRFLDGLDLQANFNVNSGLVELGGETVLAGGAGLGVGNDATLTVLSGATLRLTNDATPTGAGAVTGPGRFLNQGVVQRDTGAGEFQFNVSEFVNDGRLVLKSGRVSAAVDFLQTGGGTLAIELGAFEGPFAITGEAALDGVLEISFGDGFLPTLGQTFTLMTFGSHTGNLAFSTVGEAAREGYA